MLPGDSKPTQMAERTELEDTPENRAYLEPFCEQIGREIRDRTFDYVATFPNGAKAHLFPKTEKKTLAGAVTIRDYYEAWIETKNPPTVAATTFRDYKAHFTRYILDSLGDVECHSFSRAHLEDLRSQLREKGLKPKTMKNVIGGTLRALVRDACADGKIPTNPFEVFRWERIVFEGADPHTAEERDRVLEGMRRLLFRVGRGNGKYQEKGHYAYFAFVHLLYFTGMRPGEAAGLRVRDVGISEQKIHVRTSRVDRKDRSTKNAERVVAIDKATAEILAPLIPLHPNPEDYVFHAPEGGPVDQAKVNALFVDVQAHAQPSIRTRGLYSTKDTFCSLYLSNGGRLEWLSAQTGVAESTLKRHYARYIRTDERDAAELARVKTAEGEQVESSRTNLKGA